MGGKHSKQDVKNQIQNIVSTSIANNQQLQNKTKQAPVEFTNQTISLNCILLCYCDLTATNKANIKVTTYQNVDNQIMSSIKNDVKNNIKNYVKNQMKQKTFSSFSDLADMFGDVTDKQDLENKVSNTISNVVVNNLSAQNVNEQLNALIVNQAIQVGDKSPAEKSEWFDKNLNRNCNTDCPLLSYYNNDTGKLICQQKACLGCVGTPDKPRKVDFLNINTIDFAAKQVAKNVIDSIMQNQLVNEIVTKLQNDLTQVQGGSLMGMSDALGPIGIAVVLAMILGGGVSLYLGMKKSQSSSSLQIVKNTP